MDGDDAIKALATAVDRVTQVGGRFDVTAAIANGATVTQVVTFPVTAGLTANPTPVCMPGSSRVTIGFSALSPTAMTLSLSNWYGSATPASFAVMWAAIPNEVL